jgi:thioredoxin reductase (NADPH)
MLNRNKRYFKVMGILILSFYPIFLLYASIFSGKTHLEKKIIRDKNDIKKKVMDDMNNIENLDLSIYSNNCFGALIIGGGPAGLMAGTYCSRFGIPTAIIMGQEPGGPLMRTGIVENWPGIISMEGKKIVESSIEQAKNSKAIIFYEYVTSIEVNTYPFKVVTNKNIYYAFSIMIATGSTIKKLGCSGEERYWGKGVSSCAICDGALHKNKSVLVIGGGDSACEEALQLVPHAESIYVLVRGKHMRASQAMQEKIKSNNKIKILYETQLKEIIGKEDIVSDAILFDNEKEYLFTEKFSKKELSGVFIAIGQTPNTDLVKNIVELDHHGLIICQNRTQMTSFPGIFCGGDVSNHYRQAGVAAGEGTIAAIDMFNFLQNRNINVNFYEKHAKIWFKKDVQMIPKVSESNSVNCTDGVCSIPGVEITPQNVSKSYKIEKIKTEKEFKKLITEKKDEYYVIDIFGSNCPACVEMKRTFDEYIKKNPTLSIYLINYEELPSIRKIYKLSGVPTLLLIKNGKVISKAVGSMDLRELEKWINKHTK